MRYDVAFLFPKHLCFAFGFICAVLHFSILQLLQGICKEVAQMGFDPVKHKKCYLYSAESIYAKWLTVFVLFFQINPELGLESLPRMQCLPNLGFELPAKRLAGSLSMIHWDEVWSKVSLVLVGQCKKQKQKKHLYWGIKVFKHLWPQLKTKRNKKTQ